MKCPACNNELSQLAAGNIMVDVCQGGCGGIWFDQFELRRVDEAHESAGEHLLDVERDENINIDYNQRRRCPKCNILMLQHFFSPKRQVKVDECPQCGGYWLDAGELSIIRKQFKDNAERQKAVQQYLAKTYDAQLTQMLAKDKEQAAAARKIARMFRFICPSYYIPGKQDGGAF
jgi:Zn-finger nucleic acid-binding protein